MKTNWLMTTAAVALFASTGLAGAQGMNERGSGKSPGAAMEKSSPAPQSQTQGAEPRQGGGQTQRQTTGQSPQADSPSAPSRQQRGEQMDRQKQPSGAAQPRREQDMPKSGTAGQAPDPQKQQRTGAEQKEERQQRTGADQKQQRNGAAQKQGGDTQTRTETTGRGDAKGATLTTEQRTKIRQVVVSKKIPRVTNVNFSITVGAKLPRTVTFHPIPVEIIEIYPTWQAYRVILVGDELIIVNPSTFEIVAVIAV